MRKKFHSLKRVKIRQTWNKYNLYNLSRIEPPTRANQGRTFFQQKWEAKKASRAYHGETIREQAWNRMFRKGIRAVVPIDHVKLAKSDGSEFSQGRGSGADRFEKEKRQMPKTPYLQMTYAPVERRLDTAIFRALFASSTRQARQFVVHGNVKVNGMKMVYPGYQLNPGDMFQVDVERVLFATGAPKDVAERRAGRRLKARAAKDKEQAAEQETEESSEPAPEPASKQDEKVAKPQQPLKDFLALAKTILSTPSSSLTAKRKQDLRAFQKSVRRALSRRDDLATAPLDAQLQEILSRMGPETDEGDQKGSSAESVDVPTMSSPSLQAEATKLNAEQLSTLRQALEQARENPIDITKPYATPWRPRIYMSAFAFVPRYLEVNPKICAAVYVRHPVARPGLAEVPTPFHPETNNLAHNWYLKRR